MRSGRLPHAIGCQDVALYDVHGSYPRPGPGEIELCRSRMSSPYANALFMRSRGQVPGESNSCKRVRRCLFDQRKRITSSDFPRRDRARSPGDRIRAREEDSASSRRENMSLLLIPDKETRRRWGVRSRSVRAPDRPEDPRCPRCPQTGERVHRSGRWTRGPLSGPRHAS